MRVSNGPGINKEEFLNMNVTTERKNFMDLQEAQRELAEKITEWFSSLSTKSAATESAIARVSIEVASGTLPLSWLRSSKADSKNYWSDRSNDFEMAGAGVCLAWSSNNYHEVEKIINEAAKSLENCDDTIRIYGGISFPSGGRKHVRSDWSAFPSCRFVIPRFELIKKRNKCSLVCNLNNADVSNLKSILEELKNWVLNEAEKFFSEARISSRVDLPTFDGWSGAINSIIDDFSKGKVEKIVLARETTFEFNEQYEALALLERLSAATPQCYHYYFQPISGTAFLGASPEQLYSRKNLEITSEALAGTRPRGESSETDQTLGRELLKNEKELREHKYVVENIKAALDRLCESYYLTNATALLKLAQVQHLQTKFIGKLKSKICDADIIRHLHPTSAVGGYPSASAQSRIAQYEKFDRGWYAGAVGWLAKDAAEFAVAIRSGLMRGNKLKLFSGAGIVEGSTPEAEWAEIESKIGSFISAVTD